MLFDTPIYFLFLSATVAAYWQLNRRHQNLLLLGASYFFYGWWDWRFLALMGWSTLFDYHFARRLATLRSTPRRRALLTASLVMNFGFLGVFKYFNFFVDSFAQVASAFGFQHVPSVVFRILLPPGISFYTFQAVAYIVDVYKGRLKPSQSLVEYALFISLFPHLIAGPIQRPAHLLPQVQAPRRYDPNAAFDGLMLIISGLLRKCVIADNCALVANAVFAGQFGAPTLWSVLVGVYAFAWQIYGDFSGYSDIARGSAQLLGFHFSINFRQPYFSTSIREFWRRWHISLSTWLRDYLYIPFGGSRKGARRTYANLMMTMLLGGLWHGANWTFVAWGGLNGLGLAAERATRSAGDDLGAEPLRPSPWLWIRRLLVFHFACFGWLFFRASSFGEAFRLLRGARVLTWSVDYLGAFAFLAMFVLPLLLIDLRCEKHGEEYAFQRLAIQTSRISYMARIGVTMITLVIIGLLGASGSNAFIYFRF